MRMQHADSQDTAVKLCDAAVPCLRGLVARQAQAQVAGDVHCGCRDQLNASCACTAAFPFSLWQSLA